MTETPSPAGTAAAEPLDLRPFLSAVARGRPLSEAEAEAVFGAFMRGAASPVEMAGILMGLQARGLVAAEVAGGVRALRSAMIPVASSDPDLLVDTAGTGGGSVTTFNISTAAALVAAGAGVRMQPRGSCSCSRRCSTPPCGTWGPFVADSACRPS